MKLAFSLNMFFTLPTPILVLLQIPYTCQPAAQTLAVQSGFPACPLSSKTTSLTDLLSALTSGAFATQSEPVNATFERILPPDRRF